MTEGPESRQLRAGDVVVAPFPRLQGKRRPGLVILVVERGAPNRCVSLIAIPMTSRRAGSHARLPLRIADRLSWLLPGFAAALPPSAATPTGASASPDDLESALAAVSDLHGPNWRRRHPPLSTPPPRPRLLASAKRGASARTV